MVQFLAGAIMGHFSFRHSVQTGPGVNLTSHPVGTACKVAGVWRWSLTFG